MTTSRSQMRIAAVFMLLAGAADVCIRLAVRELDRPAWALAFGLLAVLFGLLAAAAWGRLI